MWAGDKRLVIGPSGNVDVALNTYLALNQTPGRRSREKLVRQAVATAVNKQAVVQIIGWSAHQHASPTR